MRATVPLSKSEQYIWAPEFPLWKEVQGRYRWRDDCQAHRRWYEHW